MSKPIRIIQFGLGAIGRATAQLASTKPNMQLVGAVDLNPNMVGRDLGDVLESGKKLGVNVSDKPAVLFGQTQAAAVLHCTCSSFLEAYEQIVEIVRAGFHCVTSCEEAMFPWYRYPKLAAKLDDLCITKEVVVVGTGVNPGFVMDTLALALTGACQRVDTIRVTRVVDVATRREALQRKVGVGLTEGEFRKLAEDKKIRHVGLTESLAFLGDGLGWNLEDINEDIGPVIADKPLKTKFFSVKPGDVAGVRQTARGVSGGKERLRLELQMVVDATNPRDEIDIAGEPPLKLVLQGGVAGDVATPALLVNTLARVVEARPGLHTMRTLGLPRIVS